MFYFKSIKKDVIISNVIRIKIILPRIFNRRVIMKAKNLINILLFSFVVLIFIPFNLQILAKDIQIGGKLNVSLTCFYSNEIELGCLPQANLDLELLLPRWNNSEIKCAGSLYTNINEGKIDFFWKRLYWKHRFEKLHLTIGRQPVSWSFGSLLNPVDYTIGSVALEEEYSSKYIDALEAYFPINWNTNLSIVASMSDKNDDLKIGIRGRTLVNDFDLTINVVQEKLEMDGDNQKRFGFTAKGDVGKFGIYGSLGYYWNQKNQYSFLAGADYSYFFQKGNRLYLQAEYLNLPPNLLSQITGQMMLTEEDEINKNIHLLVSNISYQIDDFSSISLTSFLNCSDGSKIIMPAYVNQIGNDTSLELRAGLITGSKKESASALLKNILGQSSQLFVEAGINYTF